MKRYLFFALIFFLLATTCAHAQFAPSYCPPRSGQFFERPVLFQPLIIDPQFRWSQQGGWGGQPMPYGNGGFGAYAQGPFGGGGGFYQGPYGGGGGFYQGPYGGGGGYFQTPYGGGGGFYRR